MAINSSHFKKSYHILHHLFVQICPWYITCGPSSFFMHIVGCRDQFAFQWDSQKCHLTFTVFILLLSAISKSFCIDFAISFFNQKCKELHDVASFIFGFISLMSIKSLSCVSSFITASPLLLPNLLNPTLKLNHCKIIIPKSCCVICS